jgi:hypothetical protein
MLAARRPRWRSRPPSPPAAPPAGRPGRRAPRAPRAPRTPRTPPWRPPRHCGPGSPGSGPCRPARAPACSRARSGPSSTRSSDQSSPSSPECSASSSTATPFFTASRPTNRTRPPCRSAWTARTAVTSAPMGRTSVVLGLAPSWRRRSRISWFGTVTAVALRRASRLRPVASHPPGRRHPPVGGQDPPPAGRGERGDETLREHPVHMQDIRVELSDESSQRHRLGGEERQHLQSAHRSRPEVLRDRAIPQVLPALREVAEAADLQRPGPLAQRRVTQPWSQHDRLEVGSLLLGQVPDEPRDRLAAPAGEGRGDDDETGRATGAGQVDPPRTAVGRADGGWGYRRGILTAGGRRPLSLPTAGGRWPLSLRTAGGRWPLSRLGRGAG